MELSQHVDNILRLLATSKNVLLMGPPATGKSKIMSLISEKFIGHPSAGLRPGTPTPIPPSSPTIETWMPSPGRTADRKVFALTFHQGTKHRDFVSGIVPRFKDRESGFKVVNGILVEANSHAIEKKAASLISIDELNRGPAVSIFGDTLASIERDKRFTDDDKVASTSAPFHVYDSDSESLVPKYLSPHVYLLGSMNEADTSVEPLDVAFLRRFELYRLEPDLEACYAYFGINSTAPIPAADTDPKHVYAALTRAWNAVNYRISIGKGDAFRLGHGILMLESPPNTLEAARQFAVSCWKRIESHVREVFFANDVAQGFIFSAGDGNAYLIEELEFADQQVTKLRLQQIQVTNVYTVLSKVGADGQQRL